MTASLTNLVDLHELGVGTRPFYGHLDDVCRRRHCKFRERPKPVEVGSYGVDGCTCLHLMRNNKKRKRSRSVQIHGEFCLITSCFHWWFRYKKRLWVQKTEGANCTTQRRRLPRREGIPMPWGQSRQEMRRWRGTGSQVPTVKQGGTLTTQFCSERPMSECAWLTLPRSTCKLLVLNSLRKDRLPRKSWPGSSISLKCFLGVTNRALHYSNQDIMRKEPRPKVHTHVHTLPPQGQFTRCEEN